MVCVEKYAVENRKSFSAPAFLTTFFLCKYLRYSQGLIIVSVAVNRFLNTPPCITQLVANFVLPCVFFLPSLQFFCPSLFIPFLTSCFFPLVLSVFSCDHPFGVVTLGCCWPATVAALHSSSTQPCAISGFDLMWDL